jgi:hypothetical protein
MYLIQKGLKNNDRLVARPTRIDVQGGRYHVVNRGIERRGIFKDEKSGPIREASKPRIKNVAS